MMKKLLLTTAMVSLSASAFADGAVPMAKDFDIKVGAEFDAQAGFRSQKKAYINGSGITQDNKNVGFDTEADLYVDAKNTTASGLTYGAHLGIQTTTQSNKRYGKQYDNRSFLFLENKDMGRVEMGSNDGAANAMSVGAANIASATGGISGDWFKYVALPIVAGVSDSRLFILSPAMALDNGVTGSASSSSTELSRKITYYTPKFNGFQFGLSYIPDVSNKGGNATLPNTGAQSGEYSNALSTGISWDGKLAQDHALKAALTGEFATAKLDNNVNNSVNNNAKVYNAGLSYTYQEKLSFAVSYINYGKTGVLKSVSGQKSSNAITAGTAYAADNFSVSLTGMLSSYNTNKARIISLGADYKLAPGLMPYAEITNFNLKQKKDSSGNDITALKNTGTAFILGTKIKF